MKIIYSFLTLLLLSSFSWSKDLGKSSPSFEVQSDEFDDKIPKGKYILEGEIIDVKSGKRMTKVSLQVVDGDKGFSNDGKFSLSIPLEKTFVAFNKNKYQRSYFEYYEAKSQHRIKVKIFMNKQGKTPQITELKPVIYAYSDSDIDFKIKLKATGDLTFTYPLISKENDWKVSLKNKQLIDSKGTDYPYLFWEAEHQTNFSFKNKKGETLGQIISKNEIEGFLDSTLSSLNLNPQEKTDFITFWGPRLVTNNFNFIQFLVQEECNQFATYEIEPTPNFVNRLFMVYTGFEHFPDFISPKKQVFNAFERNGFYLIEWGGISYPMEYFNSDIE